MVLVKFYTLFLHSYCQVIFYWPYLIEISR